MGADCDTDHYLMVVKVMEWLAVNEEAQNFDVEWYNLRKLSALEFRKWYQIKISNMSAALENLNDSEDMKRAWENIKETMWTSDNQSQGVYELRQHNLGYDE
jgi:hypothetical protein